jgi:hypothetical protein
VGWLGRLVQVQIRKKEKGNERSFVRWHPYAIGRQ